jgi:hypothetical protein
MPLMAGDQHSLSVLGCYSTNATLRLLSSSAEWVFIVIDDGGHDTYHKIMCSSFQVHKPRLISLFDTLQQLTMLESRDSQRQIIRLGKGMVSLSAKEQEKGMALKVEPLPSFPFSAYNLP